MLGSVARKRYASVARLDWQVLAADESEEAKAHAGVLKAFWGRVRCTDALNRNKRGGVRQLIYQAASCIGHYWAVHEIVWDPRPGALGATFSRIPLWFFENRTGELRFLQSDHGLSGDVLEPGGWLVHSGDGLMEATSLLVSQAGYSLGDWMAYSEKFGTPGLVWKTNASPDSPEWSQAEAAAAGYGRDWAAVVSKETEIITIEAKSQGTPQQALLEYLERRIVTLWRGADLGTMSQGAGGVGASLQGDETDILDEDDIHLIEEAIHEQVERHVIAWHFGNGIEPKAYFSLVKRQADTTTRDIEVDRFLLGAGVPLGLAETAERYGRPMAAEGAPTLHVPTPTQGAFPGPAPMQAINESSVDAVASALAEAMAPVRDRLKAIGRMSPADGRSALIALRMDLPRHLREMNVRPEAARAFERVLGRALVDGLVTTPGS